MIKQIKEDPRFFVPCPKNSNKTVAKTKCMRCGFKVAGADRENPTCDIPNIIKEHKIPG